MNDIAPEQTREDLGPVWESYLQRHDRTWLMPRSWAQLQHRMDLNLRKMDDVVRQMQSVLQQTASMDLTTGCPLARTLHEVRDSITRGIASNHIGLPALRAVTESSPQEDVDIPSMTNLIVRECRQALGDAFVEPERRCVTDRLIRTHSAVLLGIVKELLIGAECARPETIEIVTSGNNVDATVHMMFSDWGGTGLKEHADAINRGEVISAHRRAFGLSVAKDTAMRLLKGDLSILANDDSTHVTLTLPRDPTPPSSAIRQADTPATPPPPSSPLRGERS